METKFLIKNVMIDFAIFTLGDCAVKILSLSITEFKAKVKFSDVCCIVGD